MACLRLATRHTIILYRPTSLELPTHNGISLTKETSIRVKGYRIDAIEDGMINCVIFDIETNGPVKTDDLDKRMTPTILIDILCKVR